MLTMETLQRKVTMAAHLSRFNLHLKKFLTSNVPQNLGSLRNISKKGRWAKFIQDGVVVKPGELIVEQKDLDVCPGLNVGINHKTHLIAKLPGKVLVTKEKVNFSSSNPLVNSHFPDYHPVYKEYVHVIPEPQHQMFKLVETF